MVFPEPLRPTKPTISPGVNSKWILRNISFWSIVLDRFVTLLSELGLNDRLLYTVDNLSSELVKDIINYEEVNRKLTSLKIKSLAFLRNALVP